MHCLQIESTDEDEDLATPKYSTSSPAQSIVGNSKGAQHVLTKSKSTQAQCAARKSMSTQSDAGHTESATIIYDRLGDYEAKKFNNKDTRRVVKKKTVSESKHQKPRKKCIIL